VGDLEKKQETEGLELIAGQAEKTDLFRLYAARERQVVASSPCPLPTDSSAVGKKACRSASTPCDLNS